MNNYLLTILIKNDVADKERKEILDAITADFGKSDKEDLWGVRSLSYPIAHQDKAFYAHFEFQSDPSKISSLDKKLKLNEDILRYLLLRK